MYRKNASNTYDYDFNIEKKRGTVISNVFFFPHLGKIEKNSLMITETCKKIQFIKS